MADAKPRGRFVWFDLITSDPNAAKAFYTKVTGWGTSESTAAGPTPYTTWMNGDQGFGGIRKLQPGQGGPHWLGYIATPDIEQTVKQTIDLGGKMIVPPTAIPTVGTFAILHDPHGATFAAFLPESEAPGHEGQAEIREFSWHELATHDYPAAFRFYERLFGWEKTSAMDMGPTGIYQMFGRNGVVLGGMFNSSPQMPAPPGWLHYVLVDDVNRAAEAVKSGGGQLVNGPMEVPGGDWIAQCLDPQGAIFAVHGRKR